MSAVLAPPQLRLPTARLSVEDFQRLGALGIFGKRAVLIRGEVFEKMPASPEHRKLSIQLYDHLRDLRLPCLALFIESPIALKDSVPIPDVMIVAGNRSDFDHHHPGTAELIIEIAFSNESEDRESIPLFAEAGVKEYWIVLGARRQVEVHRRLEGGEYRERRTYAGDEEVVCSVLPEVRVSLTGLFS